MQGLYRGLYSFTQGEAFDLVLAGGYGADCAERSLDPALTVLDGDLDGDGSGDGRVLTLDAGSETAKLQVERISVQNGAVAQGDGGCLLLRTGGTAVVDGVELAGCTAADAGGAALVDVGDGTALVRGSILRGSSAGLRRRSRRSRRHGAGDAPEQHDLGEPGADRRRRLDPGRQRRARWRS